MKNIIIAGGGFGGLYSALYLSKKFPNKKIILFNKYNYFLFTPLLHEVATGGQNRHNVVFEIRNIINGKKNIEFCAVELTKIDFNNKEVHFNNSKMKYDKLIIALGSKATMIHIKGAKEHALPLKSIHDAIAIRNKVIRSLEKATISNSSSEINKLLTFVVMGAGPTGVELAAELSEFIRQVIPQYHINHNLIKIHLIQRGPKIIPQLKSNEGIVLAQKELEKKNVNVLTNSEIKEVSKDYILINDHLKIESYNIFWTAGVLPNTIPTTPKLTNDLGFYHVNEFFEVKNTKEVYAIGDCALNFNPESEKPNPALAQLAVKQAKHLAKNLHLESIGLKKIAFVFKPDGFLVSIGSWWAIAEIKNKLLKGKLAWWLWRTVYLTKIIGTRNTIRVGLDWFFLLFTKRDTSEI